MSRHPAAWEAAVNRRTGDPPYVRLIAELAAIGWRITELRPERLDGRVVLWHVAIVRVDDVATMTACASDPDVALAELVRYTAADAKERAP
jgi:hypothetical protein